MLAKRCEKLPVEAIDDNSEMPLKEIFFSTNKLRHCGASPFNQYQRASPDDQVGIKVCGNDSWFYLSCAIRRSSPRNGNEGQRY